MEPGFMRLVSGGWPGPLTCFQRVVGCKSPATRLQHGRCVDVEWRPGNNFRNNPQNSRRNFTNPSKNYQNSCFVLRRILLVSVSLYEELSDTCLGISNNYTGSDCPD